MVNCDLLKSSKPFFLLCIITKGIPTSATPTTNIAITMAATPPLLTSCTRYFGAIVPRDTPGLVLELEVVVGIVARSLPSAMIITLLLVVG